MKKTKTATSTRKPLRRRAFFAQIRVTKEERDAFQEAAHLMGETFGNWARRLLLAEARRVRLDDRLLREDRR